MNKEEKLDKLQQVRAALANTISMSPMRLVAHCTALEIADELIADQQEFIRWFEERQAKYLANPDGPQSA